MSVAPLDLEAAVQANDFFVLVEVDIAVPQQAPRRCCHPDRVGLHSYGRDPVHEQRDGED